MYSIVLRNRESLPTMLDAVKTPQDLEMFSHFRHELALLHRPLEPIAYYPKEQSPVSMESLRLWENSSEYKATLDVLADYPERSLCGTIDRMLLYHLVRALRPENVVEIGTYYAAGSEVMTRALWENGQGVLHTIDPFGPIRCPALIGRWNEQLQHHIRFYPWTSMEMFQRLSEQQTPIDMAFIDGNHDFEFALFDLQSAARFMRPGGVVVMDDANQSGPFWAAKVFLEQNPGWRELGDSIQKAEADPFGPYQSFFPGSKFLLLQAPTEVVVGRLPFTTGQVTCKNGQLEGVKLSIIPGQYGEVVGRVFLRAFPTGIMPEQLITSFKSSINGESELDVPCGERLRSMCAGEPQLPRHSCEIVFIWNPRTAGDALRLCQAPEPIAELTKSASAETLSLTDAPSNPQDVDSRAA